MAEFSDPPIIRKSPRLVKNPPVYPPDLTPSSSETNGFNESSSPFIDHPVPEENVFLPTPNSMVSTPPRQDAANDFSSPLTSLPPTPESLSISSSTQKGKAKGAMIHDLTDVSISEADQRSLPLPGPELQRLFRDAKKRGEVFQLFESEVARFVDGKWMAPQRCKSCQGGGKACNRKSPCNLCRKASIECEAGDFMVTIATRGSKGAVPLVGHSAAIITTVIHGAHGQNENGSWFNIATAITNGAALPTMSKRRCVSRLSRSHLAGVDSDLMDVDELGTEFPTKGGRGKKRKANDEEGFAPEESPSTNTRKRSVKKPARKGAVLRSAEEKEAFYAEIQNGKPEPFGQSPVISKTRQALCETLDWYKCYQGGAYTNTGIVKGVLCDAGGTIRDKFDDSIIITRVGGGLESDGSGNMIQTKDQYAESSLVCAFKETCKLGLPVGVVAGRRNVNSPVKWKAYYNVLDWFHVTDVWCAKYRGFQTWMFRVEKINLSEQSWWSVKDSQHKLPDYNSQVETIECEVCHVKSKHIYSPGWTCLNEGCKNHFKFENEYNEEILGFNEAFLNERTAYTGKNPGPITPPLLTNQYFDDLEKNGDVLLGTEKQFKSGIVCPKCTHCIRRLKWARWDCENPDCDFTHTVRQKIASVEAALVQNSKPRPHLFTKLLTRLTNCGQWNVSTYSFLGESGETIGYMVHFKSSPIINEQPDGPDDLFRQMQEIDLGMERRPARQEDHAGEMVTSHFATNWGAPYKYGVAQASRGFDEAPAVLIKALKRLTWAGQQATVLSTEISEEYHDPNELLTIGYFEDSTIGYHDDGETELGPTVASLSLGASATMCWRPKARSSIGASKNKSGIKGDVLRILLQHGDLMVMHGAKFQKLYDHQVIPHGQIRFALTSRFMVPEKIKTKADREMAAVKGALPPGHEKYDYDGDVDAKPHYKLFDYAPALTYLFTKLDEEQLIDILNTITRLVSEKRRV